jgi:hypothetical protein
MSTYRHEPRPRTDRPEPPASQRGTVVVILGVFAGAAVVIVAFALLYEPWTKRYSRRGVAARAIAPHVTTLTSASIAAPVVTSPYVRGKIVVVDRDESAIDGAFFELAEGLYANDASELGTLALVRCEPLLIGDFRAAKDTKRVIARAYATTCTVEVIDWSARRSTGKTTITSNEKPPREMFASFYKGDWHAKRPSAAIAKWLTRLPRQ